MSKTISFALRAAVGAALLATAGLAAAGTTVVVNANTNTFLNNVGADSGTFLTDGETFEVTATGLWRNDPAAVYQAGPNGNTIQADLTQDGLTTNIGSLVAEINGNPMTLFKVGANYVGHADATGELEFFYWDTDHGVSNNSGTVTAVTSIVPEAPTVALMGLGLGLIGLARRRKI